MSRYFLPAVFTFASLAGLGSMMAKGDAFGPYGLAMWLMLVVGQVWWLRLLTTAPTPVSARQRALRIAGALLLMLPTVPLAIAIVVTIAMEGDVTWMLAPEAIPGLIVGSVAIPALRTAWRNRPLTMTG